MYFVQLRIAPQNPKTPFTLYLSIKLQIILGLCHPRKRELQKGQGSGRLTIASALVPSKFQANVRPDLPTSSKLPELWADQKNWN